MRAVPVPYKWIEKDLRPRFPHLADACLKVYEIEKSVVATKQLKIDDLVLLEGFCRNNSSILSEFAASVVGSFAEDIAEARMALINLSGDKRINARINALVALHDCGTVQVREQVLRIALRDKSARVRQLAACKVQGFLLHSLLEELEGAIAREGDVFCRQAMIFSSCLLKDGYFLDHLTSGAVRLTIVVKNCIRSTVHSANDFREKGLTRLIQELIS